MSTRGLILGIESSCDETAAAVVERGARTLSSVVASQIATHARYGGVVPELASREHLRAIVPVVRAALAQAGVTLADLDAIAVTSGPGLAGALLVGITYAKALAFANGLPLIAVNHLEGHIHAVLLNEREAQPQSLPDGQPVLKGRGGAPSESHAIDGQKDDGAGAPGLASETWDTAQLNPPSTDPEPALALVVSGGHTHLYLARPTPSAWHYTLVGRTLDDAAGEAFDKVAKLLGLGYPGGPWIDALAQHGNPHAVPFSFSQIKPKVHLGGKAPRTKAARTAPIANLDPRFLFSFSGIKTAVLRYVELHNLRPEAESRRDALFTGPDAPARPTVEDALAQCDPQTLDLIASFQHAVIGDLMKKTFAAAESLSARRILVTGGVAANRSLRARFQAEAARRNLHVAFPTLALSTDNAAMIAAAAWPRLEAKDFAKPDLSADPSLALGG
ncbi:MAG: tRNA (adenosine(37)-N6)-threonylcarbamoyltransferase complex transferase subunit TsaD [Terracidiphilus sp.]|jgi:N6-L-threonylcarbamoyladenine synthase